MIERGIFCEVNQYINEGCSDATLEVAWASFAFVQCARDVSKAKRKQSFGLLKSMTTLDKYTDRRQTNIQTRETERNILTSHSLLDLTDAMGRKDFVKKKS